MKAGFYLCYISLACGKKIAFVFWTRENQANRKKMFYKLRRIYGYEDFKCG